MPPSDFRALLENHNLIPLSSHYRGISLENAKSMMQAAKTAGFRHFVVPVPPREIFHYDRESIAMSIKGGADPTEYFEKCPGRFVLWHVKDMDEEGKFAPVGEGTINFQEILSKKDLSGMKFYYVEQDKYL